MKEETKGIYDLKLHETIQVESSLGGKVEITRVAGGWIYCLDFPGFRQSPITFVPFNNEFQVISKPNKK